MSYNAIENNPILVDLLVACNDRGWSQDGVSAFHVVCNAGIIELLQYPVTAGQAYEVSYIVVSISSGNVQLRAGGTNGIARTTANIYVEQITPASDGGVTFYSNANCEITAFNIRPVSTASGVTIVYSAINNKWSDFRTFYPDFGWSIYTKTITGYNGQLYSHDNGGNSANNFYGTQFQSTIQIVEAKDPALIHDYQVLSYQANMLLVSTLDGILSSNGQVSTLIDTDFIKSELASNGYEVTQYQVDNVYSASFTGDQNSDSEGLRGWWLLVTLVTDYGSTPLELFSIGVRSRGVALGGRP